MTYPELDARLAAAAALFPACDIGADIGADHGRLSCYLLASGKVKKMIVADISADSLLKAKHLLSAHQLEERAEFVVADGLNAITAPVEAIAILGMGGATASKILLAQPEKLGTASLILSAHTDLPMLRETLEQLSYCLETETVIRLKNRCYVMMKAVRGQETLTPKQRFLGPRLMESPATEAYIRYLQKRSGAYSCMLAEEGVLYRQWLKEEMDRVSSQSV